LTSKWVDHVVHVAVEVHVQVNLVVNGAAPPKES